MFEEKSIELFVDEVIKCNTSGRYLSALTVALILPDICGNIIFPESKPRERYVKWFDKYIGDNERLALRELSPAETQLPFIDGETCFKLRCALLHEGRDDIGNQIGIDDFVLTFGASSCLENSSVLEWPDDENNGKSSIRKKTQWSINTVFLCSKIINGVKAFWETNSIDGKRIPKIKVCQIPEIFRID